MELETLPDNVSSSSVDSSPSISSLQGYSAATLSTPDIIRTPESLEGISPAFHTSHSPVSYHDSPLMDSERSLSSGSLYNSPNKGEFPSSSPRPSLGTPSAGDFFNSLLPESFDLVSDLNTGELELGRVFRANADKPFLEGATDGSISGISADAFQWWAAETLAPRERDML